MGEVADLGGGRAAHGELVVRRLTAAPAERSAASSFSAWGERTRTTGCVDAVSSWIGPCASSRPLLMMSTSSTVCSTSASTWLETSDRAALGGLLAQEGAQPQHALGVEAVGGLVEDEHLGIAEQRRRQGQALLHAGGVALDRALGGALELDQLERLVDARVGDAGAGGDHAQRVAPGAAGVEAGGVEQRADPCGGRVQLPVPAAEDRHRPGRRPHEVEDHAQGGRLAGAVGAQHAGDRARLDREAHVVHGEDLLAEALGQVLGLDDWRMEPPGRSGRGAPWRSLHEERGCPRGRPRRRAVR